jgi:hypothetical protein
LTKGTRRVTGIVFVSEADPAVAALVLLVLLMPSGADEGSAIRGKGVPIPK